MTTHFTYSDDFSFDEFESHMDKHMDDIINKLPSHFFQYIKKKLLETKTFFQESKFQIELVVDTNILFSEVRGLMLYNKSFFLSITDNPFIRLYAPQMIKAELYEKIEKKFPKENKTKNLDINECKRKADILLSKISLLNKVSSDALDRAKRQMEHRDKKDVPFLAVHFSMKSHGVLTKDEQHFGEQKETRVWKLVEAGEVVSEIKKGTFSFYIVSSSLPPIFEFLYGLISSVWAIIIEIIQEFIKVFVAILNRSIEGISKMHPWLLGIIGVGLLIAIFIDEAREKIGSAFKKIWEFIKEIIKGIKEFFKAIWEVLKIIGEALKPFVKASLQLFAYLASNSSKVMEQLNKLEALRPT
jgi:predicted nucleic acid-binding protein